MNHSSKCNESAKASKLRAKLLSIEFIDSVKTSACIAHEEELL